MAEIGLVLSGGGARGIAHLGMLRALEDLSIRPSAIAGVSVGALIGAFYAAGYNAGEMLKIVKEETDFNIFKLMQSDGGFFRASGLRRILEIYIPHNSFEALRIPLQVTATDISHGTSVQLYQGHLYDAIIGSAAVPGLFRPVRYGTRELLDGGILNNFPVEALAETCDHIIGCHVNKLWDGDTSMPATRLGIIEKCFHLAIAHNVREKVKACAVFIEPTLMRYSMFDVKYADDLFIAGYEATMRQKVALLALPRENSIHK